MQSLGESYQWRRLHLNLPDCNLAWSCRHLMKPSGAHLSNCLFPHTIKKSKKLKMDANLFTTRRQHIHSYKVRDTPFSSQSFVSKVSNLACLQRLLWLSCLLFDHLMNPVAWTETRDQQYIFNFGTHKTTKISVQRKFLIFYCVSVPVIQSQ